jgi:DNA-binding XRE family transcriptional regulator
VTRRRTGQGNQAQTTGAVFGRVLSIMREEAGLSQGQLAALLVVDRSTVAKIETGDRVPHLDFARGCDKHLNSGEVLTKLHAEIDWYAKVDHPDWFRRRASMDAELTELYEYQSQLVPGLLQTESYARTLFLQVDSAGPLVEERVEARLSRQLRFLEPGGPLLVALLDESCIRRVIGGRKVMRDQLDHLLRLAGLPNILIQVVPFGFEQVVAPKRPMSLITLPDGHRWVYSESLERGHLHDSPAVISRHQRTYDRLRADALSPRESAALFAEAREGHYVDEHPGPERRTLAQEQLQRQRRRQLHRGSPRVHIRRRPCP